MRPYRTVVRNRKTTIGGKPGKSRIYTDTPEDNELKDRRRQKELKKMKQKRTDGVKKLNRNLPKLNSRTTKKSIGKCKVMTEG